MIKKLQVLVGALAIAFVVMYTGNTLAYYTASGRAVNVITSGDISLQIYEKTADGTDFPKNGLAAMPGKAVSKIVTIENICKQPFYLRVKLAAGVDMETPAAEAVQKYFDVEINREKWTVRDDGYIYYNFVVEPGQITEPVFSEVQIAGEQVDSSYMGRTLNLTVNAQAVQSRNNPADSAWEASGWPAE